MQILIAPAGSIRCLYNESINLAALGQLEIQRASHVDPTVQGHWLADLSPLTGPVLGPFVSRTEALQAEQTWLEAHWLAAGR